MPDASTQHPRGAGVPALLLSPEALLPVCVLCELDGRLRCTSPPWGDPSRVPRSLSQVLMRGASLQTLPKTAGPPAGHRISCAPVSIPVFALRVGRPHYWAPRTRRLSAPRGRGRGSPWGFCCKVVGALHQRQTGSSPRPTWDTLSRPHLSPEVSRTLTVRGGHGSFRIYIAVVSPPYRMSLSNFSITS